MNVFARTRALLGHRGDAVAGRVRPADPIAAHDRAYREQIEALRTLRTSIATLLASEKRLARECAHARIGLERCAAPAARAQRLETQIDALRAQRLELEVAVTGLGERLVAMRAERTVLDVAAAAARVRAVAHDAMTAVAENAYEGAAPLDDARARSLRPASRAPVATAGAEPPVWLPDPDRS